MKQINILFRVGAVLGLAAQIHGAILAESTFDAGAEGWTIDDFYTPTTPTPASFMGGFIQTTDVNDWTSFYAPSSFLGDKSASYGWSLYFESRDALSDGFIFDGVFLTDGTLELTYATSTPGVSWTPFGVPLVASAGWKHVEGGLATESELLQVLGNLTSLRIQADWHTGEDLSDLDNVMLYGSAEGAVPEPSSVFAVACFTVAAIGTRLRKRSDK